MPSAIFASNDLMAIGVLGALQNHGLRIPQDISVIGYDDIELAAYAYPALTTLHQPKAELGRLAAKTPLIELKIQRYSPLLNH